MDYNQYQVAAIIGMWRMGAELKQIAWITATEENEVDRILHEYWKTGMYRESMKK